MANLNQLNGRQIRNGVLTNAHIAANAAIAEAKLDIDWASRYTAALQTKKVVDYVQMNNIAVSEDDTTKTIEHGSGAGKISANYAASGSDYGVTASYPVVIRDSATGSPINVDDQEVFGIISYTAAVGETPAFYTISYKIGTFASPTGVAIPAGISNIDIQYASRFDLHSVPENFGMNEKFVDGMVDITEINNLKQLAKDLYGSSWALDNDGIANLGVSIKDEIARLDDDNTTVGSVSYKIKEEALDVLASTANGEGAALIGIADAAAQYTATTVEGALAEVYDKVELLISDLADDASGKGASLIAVEDATSVFTATTVEGVLVELEDRIATLETTGNQEILDSHVRDANTTNDYFAAETFASLDARFEDIESVSDANFFRIDGDVADLVTLSGVAANAEHLGSFTGTTIADNSTVKGALQALETASENIADDVGSLVVLSGVAVDAEDLGSFTGTTIADGSTIKGALQALETKAEDVADDVGSLVVLSGVAVDAEDLGSFTGSTIADGSTIKGALQSLETKAEDIAEDLSHVVTLSGVAVDADDLGSFTGSTIADGSTIKGALQSLETASEAIADDVASLVTLSGVAVDAEDLGSFTGSTIADSSTVKGALQALETAVEAAQQAADDAQDDVDHLVTLSGVAVDSNDLGSFTGSTIADGSTIKGALQSLETKAEDIADDVASLVTLSGVAVDAEDLGSFTGATIADGSTVKGALQALETKAEDIADDVASLVTLSGVAVDAEDLGSFTGTTIADGKTVKGALQDLETQVDTNKGWISSNNTKVHTHHEETYVFSSTTDTYTTVMSYTVSGNFIGVYVNGARQLPGTHYTIAQGTGPNAAKAVITFMDDLVDGDNIYLEMIVYNS